ncbi:hypothetical protein AB0G98_21720 [Streptomyces sp. NPDC020196]|uniref:hypothetical protein n=1 Tax=Streptomyces sp. NPDC020196 TaxID=3156656 RepID=UPI0033DB9A30
MYIDFDSLPDTRVPGINILTRDQLIASLAYHEAGHAVTGMHFGMSLRQTRVYTIDVDGYTGWTGTTTWNNSYVLCANLAIELAAGAAAGTRYLRDNNLLTPETAAITAAPHDRDMAVAALTEADYPFTLHGPTPDNGSTWEQATTAAAEMTDRLWDQIATVAESLIVAPRRELSGNQIAALIGIPNPAATSAA